MQTLRRVVVRDGAGDAPESPHRRLRGWNGRATGRADRHLLCVLAEATDFLVAHCDLLVDRVAAQVAPTAEVTATYGGELAQLRAEVLYLQRTIDPVDGPA